MMDRKSVLALCSGLLLGVAGIAQAEDSAAMQAKINALEARLAQMESQQNQSWLNERRAEEVKALVREVLADADTRASLAASGATAGYQNGFFISSEDGSFLMKVNGQIQVRYILNRRNDGQNVSVNSKDYENGFEIARTKLTFSGHVADPRINYVIQLSATRSDGYVTDGTFEAAIVKLSYNVSDNLSVWIGRDKAAFAREDNMDSAKQLAVERSLVSYFFTVGYVEGAGLVWDATDALKVSASIHDGAASGEATNKDFNADSSDFAVTARVDWKVAGEWAQWNDFTSWGNDPQSILLGAALSYELSKHGTVAGDNNRALRWTVDGSYKNAGWGLFAAVFGLHTDNDQAAGNANYSLYGAVVQGSYNINDQFEPFVRYEYLSLADLYRDGGVAQDPLNILTFGFNWYQQKHSAKFTLDMVWAFNSVDATNLFTNSSRAEATALLSDSALEQNQLVLRAQYQLLF